MAGPNCHSSCGTQGVPRRQVQEELAHDRNQGDLARFAPLPQALMEMLVDACLSNHEQGTMYSAWRTAARPPRIDRWPRLWPRSRDHGASPTSKVRALLPR